jgi:hypothetical protein
VDQLSVTGGARVGWVNASWPLARLSVSDGRLRLKVTFIASYDFAPGDVIELQPRGISFLTGGVAIVHRRGEYPQQIAFFSARPEILIARIRAAGFVPAGTPEPAGPVQVSRGFAVKWQVLALVVVIWNAILLPDFLASWRAPAAHVFGPGMALAPALLFAAALATKLSPAVQRLVLKEGRSIGEVSPILNLILPVAGFLAAGFSLALALDPK